MEQYDVVVVGAGLAGLVAARGLAERGASVLLVDRRSAVDERVATTGIFVGSSANSNADDTPVCHATAVATAATVNTRPAAV